MANATRMQIAQSTTIYHRMDASNDAAQHDTPTSEALAKGLGSSSDFLLDNEDNVTYSTGHEAVNNSRSAFGSSRDCSLFLHIKHTGWTTSAMTTRTTEYITLDIGGANESFRIYPDESITLHHLGTDCDNLNNWNVASSSGMVYVEVICGAD